MLIKGLACWMQWEGVKCHALIIFAFWLKHHFNFLYQDSKMRHEKLVLKMEMGGKMEYGGSCFQFLDSPLSLSSHRLLSLLPFSVQLCPV